jgi:hypothetical protein
MFISTDLLISNSGADAFAAKLSELFHTQLPLATPLLPN